MREELRGHKETVVRKTSCCNTVSKAQPHLQKKKELYSSTRLHISLSQWPDNLGMQLSPRCEYPGLLPGVRLPLGVPPEQGCGLSERGGSSKGSAKGETGSPDCPQGEFVPVMTTQCHQKAYSITLGEPTGWMRSSCSGSKGLTCLSFLA